MHLSRLSSPPFLSPAFFTHFQSNLISFPLPCFRSLSTQLHEKAFFIFSFSSFQPRQRSQMKWQTPSKEKRRNKKLFIFFLLLMYLNYIHRARRCRGGDVGGRTWSRPEWELRQEEKKLNKTAINDNFCVPPVPQFSFFSDFNVLFYRKNWYEKLGANVWCGSKECERNVVKQENTDSFILTFNDNNRFPARSLF